MSLLWTSIRSIREFTSVGVSSFISDISRRVRSKSLKSVGIVGLNYGKINDCAFTGRIQNVKNAPSENPDEVMDEVYYTSFAMGGITGVNFGNISNSVVLLSDCGSAQYLGLISGVNIKGKGTIKDCVVLGADRWSDNGDSENFDVTANIVKSKNFSKVLKSLI